jgi:5-methyltetrahydrofolate--homocysteine methyltransferase
MLGGAPVTDAVVEFAGADAWGKDAVAAVELAKQWAGGAS